LRVGEGDRQLDGVWGVDVDRGGVWGSVSLHAANDFLTVIPIVDVRCKHLFVVVVALWDVEGIESEGGGVVGEVRESRVVVDFDFRFAVIINRLFHHFDSGGGACETLEHGDEARVRGFSDHVGRWDKYGRWCSNMHRG